LNTDKIGYAAECTATVIIYLFIYLNISRDKLQLIFY
jgi:hypothetical protein